MEAWGTPVIRHIMSHASVRSYSPDPIPDEMISWLVAAGQAAPSTCFRQVYSVIAIKNSETRIKMRALCGGQKWVEECPVFLVFCADLNRLDTVCNERGLNVNLEHTETLLSAVIDAALVAENVALAAESLGLGVVMIGGVRDDPRAVIELLNLPKGVVALIGMCVGFPAEKNRETLRKQKPRLPVEEVLHWEKYGSEGRMQRLTEYNKLIKERGVYKTHEGKPNGWTNVMARTTSQAPAENGRLELLQILREQGFEMK